MPYCAPRGNVRLLLLANDDVAQRRPHGRRKRPRVARSVRIVWPCDRVIGDTDSGVLTCLRPLAGLFLSRELKRENMWARIHLVPLLLAEGDRDAYRREQAAKAREREIMKDVRGWEVCVLLFITAPFWEIGCLGESCAGCSHVGVCGWMFGQMPVCGRPR